MKNQVMMLMTVLFVAGIMTTGYAQPRLGLKAGLNLANLKYSDFGDETDTKILPTFMVGAVLEFDLSENLGLGTGLQYHGKGAKSDEVDDETVNISYLQLPIQLQYRSNGLFVAAGPYLGYALSAKLKSDGDTEDLEIGSSVDDDLGALDYGVNLEVGYEFSQFRAGVSYSLGLANLLPADVQDFVGDAAIKNTVIGVSLTYLFGGE